MATIDETNIFAPKDPDTGQTYQLFNADAIKQKQVQSKEQYNLIKEQIKAGNLDQAYEGFTQLSFPDQMLLYINPVTGVPLESYEVVKFGAEAQPRFKTFKEFGLDMLDPRKKLFGGMLPSPVKVGDEGSALMSGMAGIGALGGAFDLVNVPKAILSPLIRKAPLYSKQEGTGGGGGIGGLSKEEFMQKEIETKARDGAFFSPLNKYLITKAPKNLKGQALLDHIVANQSKGGYKLDEIKLTGVDQYLVENPQANTQELIDYASQNKPKVFSKVLGDTKDMDEIFLPSVADPIDPLDMTDHSIFRADDISSDLQDRSYEMDMDSVLAKFTRMKDDGVITQDQLDEVVANATNQKEYTPFPADYLADDEIEALAEQISREDFFNDPYKLIELDEGVGLDLKAYGNDDVGYALIRDGEKIDLGDTIIRTEGEAQNQMRRIVDDEGLLSDLDGTAKYKSYILNEKMPHVGGTDYQEIQLNMPILDDRGFRIFEDGHYDSDFEIGTLAKIDSKLADGTDTMHIPEFQSDIHQQGASVGYDTLKDKKYYDEVKIPQLAEDFEAQAKKILGFDDREFEQLKKSFDPSKSLEPVQIEAYEKLSDTNFLFHREISDEIKDVAGGITPSTYDEYARAINTRNSLTPNYPHKDFVPFVVKHMVAKAIKEGKDTISFPTSTSILERTNTRPRKVGNIEVAQVSAPTDIDKQVYDLSRNTNKLEYKALQENINQDPTLYFGDLDAVVEHIVDLKNMDRQLNQYEFPDADFSSANTRRQYTNFEIGLYQDTIDDPDFNIEKLDQFARDYEKKLNELGYEVVERADVTVNPRLQEIYDEYGDVANKQQLRNMEAYAMQETQPLTAKAYERGIADKDFNDLLYNKNTDTFITAKNLVNDARSKVVSQGEFVINDPSLLNVDKAGIKSYPTYSSIERTFGSSVAKQIRNLADEGKIPQSYNSNFYDLADGHREFNSPVLIEKFENSMPYSLNVNKEMGGEKFITDYDKKLPSALEKIAKDYGGKFEKGSLDGKTVYGKYDPTVFKAEDLPIKRLEVNILRITPEMKKKVLEEGMSQMYKGGIVRKSQSMDRPIAGNTRYV